MVARARRASHQFPHKRFRNSRSGRRLPSQAPAVIDRRGEDEEHEPVAKAFTAELEHGPHGGHYVVVPPDVAEAVELRHGMRVRGTLNGASYRSSLMKSSGVFHLGVHKATLAAAGVAPHAAVAVRASGRCSRDQNKAASTAATPIARPTAKTTRRLFSRNPPSAARENS